MEIKTNMKTAYSLLIPEMLKIATDTSNIRYTYSLEGQTVKESPFHIFISLSVPS